MYNKIGTTYNQTRHPDPRIVAKIIEMLNLPKGSRVLDVGAGTGNYAQALSKHDFKMTAIEPSRVMMSQAEADSSIIWVNGTAEDLPFADDAFDAAILILCIHHFNDLRLALSETRRVAGSGPILIFTYDPLAIDKPWLFKYFPIFKEQIKNSFPSIETIQNVFSSKTECLSVSFPLPHNLKDAFVGSAWRYPERYLEQSFRDGTSAFRQLGEKICHEGLSLLEKDLDSGQWDLQFGYIRELKEYDHGYTFVLANGK